MSQIAKQTIQHPYSKSLTSGCPSPPASNHQYVNTLCSIIIWTQPGGGGYYIFHAWNVQQRYAGCLPETTYSYAVSDI